MRDHSSSSEHSGPATPLLDTISTPEQLRALTAEQLPELARELRSDLIHSVYQTGGHLGAGLGVVELTIALHYVFNTPEDRLIWDVGHQCYPHKILTGRRAQMHSLRQGNGLCGFPAREESEFDAFGTGHSSTSISAALGMALAASARGESRQAIAVIGDGAMTAGQAFEALNHAACAHANLLVILNDNDMSISPSVGMLAKYLRGIQSHLPDHHSDPVVRFEDQGMSLTGPVSGHNLPVLIRTLEQLRDQPGPKLLHVITRKGKGLPEAEADPVRYHAVSKVSGQPKASAKPSWSNYFGRWICAMAAQDQRLFAITPAMREGSDLVAFSEQFPQRYCDVAIAEQHAVTLAAGMACEGSKPVLAIYSTFLQRGYDQLIHDVALQNLDVLFAIDRAGLVGEDGPTHHGIFDIAALRAIPNMVLMAPSDHRELEAMLTLGYQHQGPAAVRYPRGAALEPQQGIPATTVTMGRGRILVHAVKGSEGSNTAILSFGSLAQTAVTAARATGATVADMRFIKPLDQELIQQLAQSHQRLIVVEEGAVAGGVGEQIAAQLQQLPVSVTTVGVPDRFIAHGPRDQQLQQCRLDADSLIEAIRASAVNGK